MLNAKRVATPEGVSATRQVSSIPRFVARSEPVKDAVVDALQVDHGPILIAFARVVEHDVENDLEAVSVCLFHEVAELPHMRRGIGRHAIACLGRKERDRIVAPEVRERQPGHRAQSLHGHFIEVEYGHQFERGDAEALEMRELLDQARERAGPLDTGAWRAGKTPHVQLIEHRIRQRNVRCGVAFPVVVAVIGHQTAHRRGDVIARVACRARHPELPQVGTSVGVDQYLVRIETMPEASRVRIGVGPVEAVGVTRILRQSVHLNVPKIQRACCESNYLRGLHVRRIGEQQQVNVGGMLRED